MSRRNATAPRPRVRCAVYTRKSTSEGLNQDFNSLDAQREAAEAYIASQRREGWVCLPQRYDDGGYTGGNMDRPALKRLLADLEAGKVDCIVTYKVDRLSRSLLDFARITETLDKHAVAFVAVTQQFNTTHSMGRLTLNILLSFAEFERQIIAERTRDKMAAARRRGKWVGGVPVLGYDLQGGRLVRNPAEAQRVHAIFELYLELGSLILTVRELARRGWRTKRWMTRKGVQRGGRAFRKNSLHYLLTNVAYCGKVRCDGDLYEGEHEPIVSEQLFQGVQELLRANRRCDPVNRTQRRPALLAGLLFCGACNRPMQHTHTSNGARRYRYYACSHAQQDGTDRCPASPIPAAEVERFVREEIENLAASVHSRRNGHTRHLLRRSGLVARVVERVEYDVRGNTLMITLKGDANRCLSEMLDRGTCCGGRPMSDVRTIRRKLCFRTAPYSRRELQAGEPPASVPPGRVARVARLMAIAIRFDELIRKGVVRNYAELARLGHVTRARLTQIMRLRLLASDIQEALLFLPPVEVGREPITERDLRPIVAIDDWQTQRRLWAEVQPGSAPAQPPAGLPEQSAQEFSTSPQYTQGA